MQNDYYSNRQPRIGSAPNPDFLKKPDTLDLREFGRTLRRRRRMIILITAITLLLALLITLLSKPVYRATATLQIERESSKVVNLDNILGSGDIRDTRDFYQTQFELIRSRALVAQVITDLKLETTLASTSMLGQIKAWFSAPDVGNQQTAREELLLNNLTVEPVKNSRLVAISYTSSDPAQAAAVANAVVSTFKNMSTARRVETITEISRQLQKTVEDSKAQLETSEQRFRAYAREHQLSPADLESASTSPILPPPAETAASAKTRDEIISAYRSLQREVDNHQAFYNTQQKSLIEISSAKNAVIDNIALVDPAQVPLKKFKPNLPSNLLFGGLLGVLLGISAAFMREFLDDTIKDINELERATQLPVLGAMAETTDANSRQLATATVSKPRSAIAEAFRSLRTSLRFTHQGDDTPIIFITSASPNEGKTTTASNLACAYASAGNRVLLIDADLRNPSLHKTLGIHAQNGLSNYLSGILDVRKLIQATDIPNLFLLTAGSLPDDPAELLSSPHMRTLLDSAKYDFDQIIVDGPPVLGLADALILASQSSATLIAVRAEHTRMVILKNALNRLRREQAPLVGVVLNRVDLSSSYGDDYGGYVYQAEEQRVKPTMLSKWLAALKKL
ncbi:MAG: polysaccharide biosynthesis tyrosine autokinase [Candidatus Thiothrix sulfatifontis]|nr:MAG: polysaccharide biosynthesis tyrosine autokinase [Candidatus Thiothrix sulfatifontis]